MATIRNKMVISPLWLQVAILTFLAGFAVLGYLALRIHREQPPLPSQVLTEEGAPLFDQGDIMAGQHLFQKRGLMQFGSLFGHGAYLGPDFTAQYLHLAGTEMLAFHQGRGLSEDEAAGRVRRELKANAFDSETGLLTYTGGQAYAFDRLIAFYTDWFGPQAQQDGLLRPHIADPQQIRKLTAYFSWAAWTTTATRPGTSHSYTNNWPPEPLAGNSLTAEALLWSVLSLVALLGGSGIVLFVFGRFDWLGWQRHVGPEDEIRRFRDPDKVRLSPSQRAMPWYFLVVAGLFLNT